MKLKSIETANGKTVITTETKWLWFSRERQFVAARQLTENYWEWLELPDNKIVLDSLSFQLDAWKRMSKHETGRSGASTTAGSVCAASGSGGTTQTGTECSGFLGVGKSISGYRGVAYTDFNNSQRK